MKDPSNLLIYPKTKGSQVVGLIFFHFARPTPKTSKPSRTGDPPRPTWTGLGCRAQEPLAPGHEARPRGRRSYEEVLQRGGGPAVRGENKRVSGGGVFFGGPRAKGLEVCQAVLSWTVLEIDEEC